MEGNALYSQGQFTAAFQCYEAGLEAERHNMALHCNAAQVLIKMGCYAQAIEHCDKVHPSTQMGLKGVQDHSHAIFASAPVQFFECNAWFAGSAFGRISPQQAVGSDVCQGTLEKGSCKKGKQAVMT